MCGIHHITGRILEETTYRRPRERHGCGATSSWQYYDLEPKPSIEQEVKLMYARGDIDANAYRRLLALARTGQLSRSDLALIRSGTAPADRQAVSTAARQRDPEIVNDLNRLNRHRSKLIAAQKESAQVLEKLEADVRKLHQQAAVAAQKAKQVVVTDEATARAYLAAQQEAIEKADKLEERVSSLRQDLRRIETLRDELATREAELNALESREHLADLESNIREDLLLSR